MSAKKYNEWVRNVRVVAGHMENLKYIKAVQILRKAETKNYIRRFAALQYIQDNLDTFQRDFILWYIKTYPCLPPPTKDSISNKEYIHKFINYGICIVFMNLPMIQQLEHMVLTYNKFIARQSVSSQQLFPSPLGYIDQELQMLKNTFDIAYTIILNDDEQSLEPNSLFRKRGSHEPRHSALRESYSGIFGTGSHSKSQRSESLFEDSDSRVSSPVSGLYAAEMGPRSYSTAQNSVPQHPYRKGPVSMWYADEEDSESLPKNVNSSSQKSDMRASSPVLRSHDNALGSRLYDVQAMSLETPLNRRNLMSQVVADYPEVLVMGRKFRLPPADVSEEDPKAIYDNFCDEDLF